MGDVRREQEKQMTIMRKELVEQVKAAQAKVGMLEDERRAMAEKQKDFK
jgi:hypothetical protein